MNLITILTSCHDSNRTFLIRFAIRISLERPESLVEMLSVAEIKWIKWITRCEGYLAGSLSIAPQPESRIREEGEVAIKNFSKAKTNEETKQKFERSLIKDDSKIV